MALTRFSITACLTFALFLVGCTAGTRSVLDERLTDGRTVREILDTGQPTAVLVYSPGDCFACNSSLQSWKQLEDTAGVRLRLILASEPTNADSRSLVIQRLEVAGVLDRETSAETTSPREYFIVDGRVLAWAVGMGKTGKNSELLQFATRYQSRVHSAVAVPPAQSTR